MSIIIAPPRFPLVPWLWASDLEEGRACIGREDRDDRDHCSAWAITPYEKTMPVEVGLVVHAVRGNGNDGGVITLAIHDVQVCRTVFGKPRSMNMALLQSNPRRAQADGDDGD